MMGAARNLDLETKIRQNPDDIELRLVYADWLSNEGDPRGELIALQHAIANASDGSGERFELIRKEEELLDRRATAIFGPAAAYRQWFSVRWQLGFVDVLSVRAKPGSPPMEDIVSALVQSPVSAFTDRVILAAPFEHDLQPAFDAIAAAELPLRVLEVGQAEGPKGNRLNLLRGQPQRRRGLSGLLDRVRQAAQPQPSVVQDITEIARLDRLERLRLTGPGIALGDPINHPRLRHLALRGALLDTTSFADLGGSRLEELETLEITLSSPDFQISHLSEGLEGTFPALVELELYYPRNPDAILRALPDWRISAQLMRVYVGGYPTVDALQRTREALPHLRIRT